MDRRNFLKIATASAAVSAIGLPLPAIRRAKAAGALPEVIRLAGPGEGYGKNYGGQIIGLLRASGLLEEEFKSDGVKIEWSFPAASGPAINEAFANKQLDFGSYGGQPGLAGRSRGLPTRLLASSGKGNIYIAARKESGIKTVADLKGRKVSVDKGTILQLLLGKVLAANGLTEKDLQLFSLKSADQAAAISSGDVDAGIDVAAILALRDKGVADIVYTTRGKVTPFNTFGGLTVVEEFARAYPEATQRVVNAYLKAAHWGSKEENRDAVVEAWARSGVAPSIIAYDAGDLPLIERNNPLFDSFTREQYTDGNKFLLESKIIRKPVELEEWVDLSYIDRGLKELNLASYWPAREADGTLKS